MSIKSKSLQNLIYEESDKIGVLTVARPDKLNALNREVLEELLSFLEDLHKDRSWPIKGLILTGAGEKAFIAGADIEQMSHMEIKEALNFGKLGQRVTLLLETLRVPVIAAVNGYALGGGLEMAMGCDFILATKNAVFGLPEVKLGLIPGFGGTQRLSRLIGRHKAKEIIYTGRNVKVEEALELGLINGVYENREKLLAAAKGILNTIKQNSPYAISLAKKVMNAGNDRELKESLSLELEEFSNIFSSQDMKEGTRAFLEKRTPQFKGE